MNFFDRTWAALAGSFPSASVKTGDNKRKTGQNHYRLYRSRSDIQLEELFLWLAKSRGIF